jgi:hypothetical protein
MASMRFMQVLVCAGALLAASSLVLFFKRAPLSSGSDGSQGLLASNTYFGPTNQWAPGNSNLIRVQILIRDSDDDAGPQVLSVTFNQKEIPLKPRDIYGNRGTASFQLPPGKYKLQWKTNQDKVAWPRNTTHEEELTLSPRDLWIQIEIDGDKASIS